MHLFDTLSGEKKELTQPRILGIFKKSITMFVCGPTVYDTPHIGNARTFVFFDMFVKYLRSQGFKVFYLQNITDVDDKIIQRSMDEKTTWQAISERYSKVYHDNMAALGVSAVNKYAPSTDFIPEVVAQVRTLIKKGHVYKIEGDGWYFDLTTYPEYGQLARRTVAQAEDGVTRVDNSEKKRNAGDFCVWKFSKQNEPTWPAGELGEGRPGWHIEDTAITEHCLGQQYQIHGGALDLKFPHHEAERAQQESASGKKPFVNIWMHAGFLTINGQKMSKSKPHLPLNSSPRCPACGWENARHDEQTEETSSAARSNAASFPPQAATQGEQSKTSDRFVAPPQSATEGTPSSSASRAQTFLTCSRCGASVADGASGNFMTIDDLLKKMTADEFRMMLVMNHYRSPLDYSETVLHAAKKNLADLGALIARLALTRGSGAKPDLTAAEKGFNEAMNDDFNTPRALARLFELAGKVNTTLWQLSPSEARELATFFTKTLGRFGITLKAPEVPQNITKLAQDRELSRASKQFAQADALRAQVEQLGYVIEDTPAGPLVLPK